MHRIMLVDDERILRLTFEELLRDRGYTVLTLADGAEAVRAHEKFQPHVAFVDLWMPEADGFATIHQLARAAPELPIVAISGAGEQVAHDHALRLGATKFLSKPFTVDAVVRVVEQLCPLDSAAAAPFNL